MINTKTYFYKLLQFRDTIKFDIEIWLIIIGNIFDLRMLILSQQKNNTKNYTIFRTNLYDIRTKLFLCRWDI